MIEQGKIDILSVTQLAQELDTPAATVREWVRKGLFAGAHKIGNMWIIPRPALKTFSRPVMGPTPPTAREWLWRRCVQVNKLVRKLDGQLVESGRWKVSRRRLGAALDSMGNEIERYRESAECGADFLTAAVELEANASEVYKLAMDE